MDVAETWNITLTKYTKKALKLVYNDTPSLIFDEVLVKGKSASIIKKNLELLTTEIFKIKNGITPELMTDIFQFVKKPDNLRNTNILHRQKQCILVVKLFLYYLQKFGNLVQIF